MCGVAGLRPSAGLVADTARSLGWSALSVVGPMARSIADMALLLSAMTGLDAGDPLSYDARPGDFWPLESIDLSTLRIAYTEDLGFCAIDDDIRRVFRSRMASIADRVACCEPVALELGEVDRTFDIARAEAFVASFSKIVREAPETLSPNIRANLEIASGISLADRAWAHEEQTRIMRSLQSVYERYDLLIAPVCSISPLPWPTLYATEVGGRTMRNYYEWVAPTYAITLTAHPALSLPCGLDEKGMPFGLQLVGPFRGDARLLAMAHALEQSTASEPALARPRPDLSQLMRARPELKQIVTHPPMAARQSVA
jgi:Asp-tRNA(Asn)/Glu-tRNA(Gln) amidotransferase A subunit family amidase